jgi:hypothetical protein
MNHRRFAYYLSLTAVLLFSSTAAEAAQLKDETFKKQILGLK